MDSVRAACTGRSIPALVPLPRTSSGSRVRGRRSDGVGQFLFIGGHDRHRSCGVSKEIGTANHADHANNAPAPLARQPLIESIIADRRELSMLPRCYLRDLRDLRFQFLPVHADGASPSGNTLLGFSSQSGSNADLIRRCCSSSCARKTAPASGRAFRRRRRARRSGSRRPRRTASGYRRRTSRHCGNCSGSLASNMISGCRLPSPAWKMLATFNP